MKAFYSKIKAVKIWSRSLPFLLPPHMQMTKEIVMKVASLHFKTIYILSGRSRQTQNRYATDACTLCTLLPTRHSCVLGHDTCQMIPGVRFSMTDAAHNGAPVIFQMAQGQQLYPLAPYNTCSLWSEYKNAVGRHRMEWNASLLHLY